MVSRRRDVFVNISSFSQFSRSVRVRCKSNRDYLSAIGTVVISDKGNSIFVNISSFSQFSRSVRVRCKSNRDYLSAIGTVVISDKGNSIFVAGGEQVRRG